LNCDCWAIAERMTEYKRKREREKKKRKIIMGDKSQAGCRGSARFSLDESIYEYERWDI